MDRTIKGITTEYGALPYDYTALANQPVFDKSLNIEGAIADAAAVGARLRALESSDEYVPVSREINGKPLSSDIDLSAEDVGAAETLHKHSASDITSGALSMDVGGTGANNGKDGLKNLLASGAMILSDNQYGDATPTSGEKGQIFFVRVQ